MFTLNSTFVCNRPFFYFIFDLQRAFSFITRVVSVSLSRTTESVVLVHALVTHFLFLIAYLTEIFRNLNVQMADQKSDWVIVPDDFPGYSLNLFSIPTHYKKTIENGKFLVKYLSRR